MDTLTLYKTTNKIGADQTVREYLDFFVSGKSLKTILNIETAEYITLLTWMPNEAYRKHILNVFRLQEKSELESGRVIIYVCNACVDINCGGITALVKEYGDKIIWSEFGYESDRGGLTVSYNQIEPIEFDRTSYFSVFSKIPHE
jgi:hypothetical protein